MMDYNNKQLVKTFMRHHGFITTRIAQVELEIRQPYDVFMHLKLNNKIRVKAKSGKRFEIYWTTKYKALEYIQRAGLEITSKGRGRVK